MMFLIICYYTCYLISYLFIDKNKIVFDDPLRSDLCEISGSHGGKYERWLSSGLLHQVVW
jgi:hypothetical protein